MRFSLTFLLAVIALLSPTMGDQNRADPWICITGSLKQYIIPWIIVTLT